MQTYSNPMVKSLEQRRLLSVSLHGGLLAIKGTRAANDIEIKVDHSSVVVTIDGASKSFNLSDIRRVRAMGGKGNDNIHFNSAGGKLSVPMMLMRRSGIRHCARRDWHSITRRFCAWRWIASSAQTARTRNK